MSLRMGISKKSLPDVQSVVGEDRVLELHGDVERLACEQTGGGDAAVGTSLGQTVAFSATSIF